MSHLLKKKKLDIFAAGFNIYINRANWFLMEILMGFFNLGINMGFFKSTVNIPMGFFNLDMKQDNLKTTVSKFENIIWCINNELN